MKNLVSFCFPRCRKRPACGAAVGKRYTALTYGRTISETLAVALGYTALTYGRTISETLAVALGRLR